MATIINFELFVGFTVADHMNLLSILGIGIDSYTYKLLMRNKKETLDGEEGMFPVFPIPKNVGLLECQKPNARQ
jgi:hypothetical protein